MNIHVPQNPLARAEAMLLMLTTNNILTSQKNAPIIGPIQDSLLGGYFMTSKRCMVEWDEAMNLVFKIGKEGMWVSLLSRAEEFYPEIVRDGRCVSLRCPGRLLISILFPEDFKYKKRNDVDKEEPVVRIKKGIWLSGEGDKGVFGGKANSVVHRLALQYSYEAAGEFIDTYQFQCVPFLTRRGFSVGIMDTMTESTNAIRDELSSISVKCDSVIRSELDPVKREKEINAILNKATNIGRLLANDGLSRGKDNAFNSMLLSGSKGNHINISQILALVGQQNVLGDRIPKQLAGGKRTLPCFTIEEADSPEARGFVGNCYINGLNPWETFFHAESGREGVISTSISTAETGYIQRQIGKKLEDNVVWEDYTVRDGKGKIAQMVYGNLGMNPKRLCYPKGCNIPFFTDPTSVANRLNCNEDKSVIEQLSDEFIKEVLNRVVFPGEEKDILPSIHAGRRIREILRDLLVKVKLSTDQCVRATFLDTIEIDFKNSLIVPGDAVGLLSTLSIGEPTTQNSVRGNEKLMYIDPSGYIKINTFAGFIDAFCNDSNSAGEGSNIVNVSGYKVVSVSKNGTVSWSAISQLSRHPSNGNLVRIVTKSEKTVTATLSHSFLKRATDGSIEPVLGSEIRVGDVVPVAKMGLQFTDTIDRKIVGWEEIVKIEHIPDPKEYVYDLTVPGNESFAIANGILVHNTLSFFHLAGVSEKNVTLGVPKIKELLHVSKTPKTPSCSIFFDESKRYINPKKEEKVNSYLKTKQYGYPFEYVVAGDLLKGKVEIEYLDEVQPEASSIVNMFFSYKKHETEWWETIPERNETEKGDWVVVINFDVKKLYYYNIKLATLTKRLEKMLPGDVYCTYSPMALGRVVVYIDFSTTVEPAVSKLKMKDGILTSENINYFYARDVVAKKINKVYVQGVPGIEKTFPRCFERSAKSEVVMGEEGEWYIDTQGSNLRDVLAQPGVDKTRTVSDNVWEIYECLGLGAAREFLIKEFHRVLTFNGTYIHPANIELLVDVMCKKKEPSSTKRHGIDKKAGPIARISYEETIQNFTRASTFGEVDDMTTISAQIAAGKLVRVGCGFLNRS